MSPDQLGQVIRKLLAERDRRRADHLMQWDVYRAADDQFVGEVAAAAGADEALLRELLAERDKTCAADPYREDTRQAATDAFVAEVLGAAGAGQAPDAATRPGRDRGHALVRPRP